MSSFEKILWLCTLIHVTVSSESLDLSGAVNTSWTQALPRETGAPYPKPIFDLSVGENNHSLALLRFNDPIPKLAVLIHSFDGKYSIKTCPVALSAGDDSDIRKTVTFLRNDRVLVTIKENFGEHERRMKSRVVMMDTCQSSEPIIIQSRIQRIVPFKNHFDVVVYKEKRCPVQHYCKMSFDHDGKPIDNDPIPLKKPYMKDDEHIMSITEAYPINYNGKEGMVLAGRSSEKVKGPYPPEVYSPITGWSQMDDVGHFQIEYSNSSGFASICWFTGRGEGIGCKWLDAHVNSQVLKLELDRSLLLLPTIYNTADGRILIMQNEKDGKKVFIDQARLDGKCSRVLEITVPERTWKIKLSISNKNKYCFSVVFSLKEGNVLKNTFATKCIQMPETRVEDSIIKCGKDFASS